MHPERWRRLAELFEAASRLPPADRPGFLERACGDDAELRREVQSLLAAARPFLGDRRD
jgi:eukaryotic-like serine/threonine-protein kinase